MADVWKSCPKKFCEICKCWFYDNKASIEHHERGRRHQEAVKNKLRDLGRKGREKEFEEKQKYIALMQMERGAMAAYKKDSKGDPKVASAYNLQSNLASFPSRIGPIMQQPQAEHSTTVSERPSTSTDGSTPVWCEIKSVNEAGDATAYFWNMQTDETVWELPDGVPYISLADRKPTTEESSNSSPSVEENVKSKQPASKTAVTHNQPKRLKKESDSKPQKIQLKIGTSIMGKKENEESTSESSSSDEDDNEPETTIKKLTEEELEKARKPYGDWQPVEAEKPPKADFSYLPQNRWMKVEQKSSSGTTQETSQSHYSDDEDEEDKVKLKFEERKAPSLNAIASPKQSSGSGVSFKKRKLPANGRSIRNRDE